MTAQELLNFAELPAWSAKERHDMRRLSYAMQRNLRSDLTEAEKAEALHIGRIKFKSAGAVRKR